MLSADVLDTFDDQVTALRNAALFKDEQVLTSEQSTLVKVEGIPAPVLNMCANNYLGLSGEFFVKEAARKAIERFGYGLSSIRAICGTHEVHKALEHRLSRFLKTEDTILYSSCFDVRQRRQ